MTPRPKFWERKPEKPKPNDLEARESTRKRSDRQEKRIAKDEGGFKTPGSGAFSGHKSDISGERFRYEAKTTRHRSIRVHISVLAKIDQESRRHGQFPVLVISFEDLPADVEQDYYIVPRSVWREIAGGDAKR